MQNLEYPKNNINDGTMDKDSTGYCDDSALTMSESDFETLRSLFCFDLEDAKIKNTSGDDENCDIVGWPLQDNNEKALTPE